MGPPLGHVRDPDKQSRFVEAELSALLQAAGGTMPVIKKDARGVFVIVEGGGEHSHAKPAAAKAPAAQAAAPKTPDAPKPAPAPAPAKPAEHKAGAQPNRQLFKRSTYSGVKDIGPVAGETFEQKVARLKELSAAAKRRAEEGGEPTAPAAVAPAAAATEAPAAPAAAAPVESTATAPSTVPAASSPAPAAHKPTGNADRTLMKRSTYGDVVDTGPVPGETFEQKVARLAALAAAAKQRAEGG